MADWQAIKTEYITTDTSYRKLAEKYGVHYQTICARSKAEGWVLLREQFRNKVITKTVEKNAEKTARKAARVSDLADKLMVKLEKAIDELDLKVTTHKIKTERVGKEETIEYRVAEPGGTVDRAGLRQLTAALKDLKEVKGILSDLEKQEKQARIDQLRRQAEKNDAGNNDGLTVILEGVDEYAG